MVNIKDGYALQLAVKYGYEIAIITGGTSLAVKTRYEGLGITNIFQGSAKKLPVLTAWMESKGLEPDEVAYMGDDIPDLPGYAPYRIAVCAARRVYGGEANRNIRFSVRWRLWLWT